MPSKTVEITASLKEKYLIDLNARNFNVVIDQPEAMGGDNKGPTPLEYFLFSLAGCYCSIGRIIANQKRLNINGIDVKVEGDLDTDVLMGKDKSQRPGFQNIRVNIKVDADMSREEKEKFVEEIEDRCPISDNMENVSSIELIVD